MKSTTQEFTKVASSCLQTAASTSITKQSSSCKPKKHKLNLFGKGITYIKPLSQQQIYLFENIKQVDLSHNAVTSIQNLKSLAIQQLNLSHNKLQQQQKIVEIFLKCRNCELSKNLKKISLKGNPFLKKPLSSEVKMWLFSVENDLQLYSKEEYEYLDLLVQRVVEKVMLENLLGKISLNLQYIQEYGLKSQDDYERLLLMRPEDYFKVIKRQMQWKIQAQPFISIKKQVVLALPLQLFNSVRQRSQSMIKHYASSLVLELRKRNEQLIKQNKETVNKIQGAIFNYLTQKKILIERKQKSTKILSKKNEDASTPYKNLFIVSESSRQTSKGHLYPQANTPVEIRGRQSQSTSKRKVSLPTQQPQSSFRLKNVAQSRHQNNFMTPYMIVSEQKSTSVAKQERNPFDQIVRQSSEEYEDHKESVKIMREISKNKENFVIRFSPPKTEEKVKKIEIKNSSKTLFELSQSLLQRPVLSSDESLHFQLEEGIAESQIEKMFFQILTKLNPIYHLLYSPLQSLKQSQKSSLITNLLDLLKDKLKYIEKLQKYKLLYDTDKQRHEQLLSFFNKQKEIRQEVERKKQNLQQQVKQFEKEVGFLSQEIQAKAQENFILEEKNQRLRDMLTQYNQIKMNRDEEERIEDIIRMKKDMGLKKQYLNVVIKKAQKFTNFKEKMAQLKQETSHFILNKFFADWAKQAKTTKKQQILLNKTLKSNLSIFNSTIRSTFQLNKDIQLKLSFLSLFLKSSRFHSTISKLSSNKSINNHKRIAQNYYFKNLKQKLFRVLYSHHQVQKQIQYDQMVAQFRTQSKERVKKWVFNEWLVWQRGLLHKQVEIRVNHEGILACNVIGRLCQFTSYQRLFQSKSLAIEMYLRDMRKLNSFHRLYLFMSTQTQKWKLKLFKINMFTKRTYFDEFLDGVRFLKNKRKIKKKDDQMTQRKLQFNQLSEFKLRRHETMEKVQKKLRMHYFDKVKDLMKITRKQIEAETMLSRNKAGFVFDKLRALHKAKSRFRAKVREVHYLARSYHSLQSGKYSINNVFKSLKSQLRFKHLLVNFFINKNKRLLQKTFYEFRINCFQQRALFFENKLKEIGPDIDLIEERQIQTNIEKVSLARQIELKNLQIDEYEKEVHELRLLLQAKEIKYEKLKDIYAQSVEINSRSRDLYELQDKIQPQILPSYEYKPTISSTKRPQKQDHYTKTLKFDSKYDPTRDKPYYPTTSYSPQRDIKMSKQKRLAKPTYRADSLLEKTRQEGPNKDRLSEFYPGFRRF